MMPTAPIPATIRPEQVTTVVDSREQLPLDLDPLQTMRGTLTTGDYSVVGLENVIAIERKSLPDLLGCIGRERERFEREAGSGVSRHPEKASRVKQGKIQSLRRNRAANLAIPSAPSAVNELCGLTLNVLYY